MTPTSQHLQEADLLQIEHALLAALLDVSGERSNAIEQFLSRFEGSRPEVEQLLVAAVSDTESGRSRTLDHMLHQLTTSAPTV
jgi:hypothetical protein